MAYRGGCRLPAYPTPPPVGSRSVLVAAGGPDRPRGRADARSAGRLLGRPPARPWCGAALGQRRAVDERSACPGGRAGPGREGGVTPSRLRCGATRRVRPFAPGRSARPPTNKAAPSTGIGGSPPFGGCGPSPGIRGRGGEWQPVPPVWAANPHRRIVLFEGLNCQGRDHAVGLSYTGQLWDTAGAGGGGGSCTARWRRRLRHWRRPCRF